MLLPHGALGTVDTVAVEDASFNGQIAVADHESRWYHPLRFQECLGLPSLSVHL
jgi:hypothetical protein